MSGPQISIMSCLESAQRNFGDPIWILVTQFWHIFTTHLHQVVPVISRKKRRLLRFQHFQLWSFGRRGDLKRGAFFAGPTVIQGPSGFGFGRLDSFHPLERWVKISGNDFTEASAIGGKKTFTSWYLIQIHAHPKPLGSKSWVSMEKIIPSLPQRFSHIS